MWSVKKSGRRCINPMIFVGAERYARGVSESFSRTAAARAVFFFGGFAGTGSRQQRGAGRNKMDAAHDAKPRQFYAEGRTQRTMSGILVRSKSEVILADTLTMLEIPFLYEAAARLVDEEGREVVLHPDFTILCPDGSVIYWEHLGLLQEKNYTESFARKLRLYHRNGFTIGQQLIVTADDRSGHINSRKSANWRNVLFCRAWDVRRWENIGSKVGFLWELSKAACMKSEQSCMHESVQSHVHEKRAEPHA